MHRSGTTGEPTPGTVHASAEEARVISKDSLTTRFLLIALLALALLIPLFFVGGVAEERQGYYHRVVDDIGQGWGRAQVVVGPLLAVPATDTVVELDDDGNRRQRLIDVTHVFLPDVLNAAADVRHEFR